MKSSDLIFNIENNLQNPKNPFDLDCHHIFEASAGTGKTTTLIHIILSLILEGKAEIHNILLTTFNVAAKEDLESRLFLLLSETLKNIPTSSPSFIRLKTALNNFQSHSICTMDSFAQWVYKVECADYQKDISSQPSSTLLGEFYRIIQEIWIKKSIQPPFIQAEPSFDFWDTIRKNLIIDTKKGIPLNPIITEQTLKKWLHIFSVSKSQKLKLSPHYYQNEPSEIETLKKQIKNYQKDQSPEILQTLFMQLYYPIFDLLHQRFLEIKEQESFFDYEDVYILLLALWNKNGISNHTKSQFSMKYVFIDEFQDINFLQWTFFDHLFFKQKQAFFYLVGDPKQSIYSFRGGESQIFYMVEEILKKENGKKWFLNKNYRSHQELLSFYNKLFPDIFKQLNNSFNKHITYQQLEYGKSIKQQEIEKSLPLTTKLFYGKNDPTSNQQKAYFLINSIHDLQMQGVSFSDIAILYDIRNEIKLIRKYLAQYYPTQDTLTYKELTAELFALKTLFHSFDHFSQKGSLNYIKESYLFQHVSKSSEQFNEIFTSFYYAYQKRDFFLLRKYFEYYIDHYPFHTLIKEYLLGLITDYGIYYENKKQLKEPNSFADYEKWIQSSAKKFYFGDSKGIFFSTVHSSKGLEFAYVFLLGSFNNEKREPKKFLDQVVLQEIHQNPSIKIDFNQELYQQQQELDKKCLFYVGMTRAKRALHFFYTIPDRNKILDLDLLKNHFGEENSIDLSDSNIDIYNNIKKQTADSKIKDQDLKLKIFLRNSFSNLDQNIPFFFHSEYSQFNILQKLNHVSYYLPTGNDFGLMIHQILEQISKTKTLKNNPIQSLVKSYFKKFGFMDYPYEFFDSNDQNTFMQQTWKNYYHLKNNRWILQTYPSYNTLLQLQPLFLNEKGVIETTLIRILNDIWTSPLNFLGQSLNNIPLNQRWAEITFSFTQDLEINNDPYHYTLSGILDLVVENQENKFFIVDYKTNTLNHYSHESLAFEIKQHYELQYQIYFIAVVKVLIQHFKISIDQLEDFYQKKIGGFAFIFIKGIEDKNKGIYFIQPSFEEYCEWNKTLQNHLQTFINQG